MEAKYRSNHNWAVSKVWVLRFLGTTSTITNSLKWFNNTTSIFKIGISSSDSKLNVSQKDPEKILHKLHIKCVYWFVRPVVHSPRKITKLKDISTIMTKSRAVKLVADTNHPSHHCFAIAEALQVHHLNSTSTDSFQMLSSYSVLCLLSLVLSLSNPLCLLHCLFVALSVCMYYHQTRTNFCELKSPYNKEFLILTTSCTYRLCLITLSPLHSFVFNILSKYQEISHKPPRSCPE